MMLLRILVPLDGSEMAEHIFPHVKAIAQRCKAEELILLNVVEPLPYALRAGVSVDLESIKESLVKQRKEYVLKAQSVLAKEGLSVKAEVREGRPAETIIDFAEENGISLIAMATHGRTGVSRWALGSVADKVVRSSHIPVLLIRRSEVGAPTEVRVPKSDSSAKGDDSEHVETSQLKSEAEIHPGPVRAEIRPMNSEDIDAILVIDRKISGIRRALTYQDTFNEIFGGEIDVSFVAEVDNQVTGFILARLTYVPEEIGQVCLIQNLGVDPECRKQGIGGSLIGAVINKSRSKGVKAVHVMVDQQDSQLKRLFEHTGFRRCHLVDYCKAV